MFMTIPRQQSKPDLDSSERIANFVDAFYGRLLADATLAPVFLEVAEIDISQHLPHIRTYWEKLLLGGRDYRRHTMLIHRELHAKRGLGREDFQRWLDHFNATVDANFVGPNASRAKQLAETIAQNMQNSLS